MDSKLNSLYEKFQNDLEKYSYLLSLHSTYDISVSKFNTQEKNIKEIISQANSLLGNMDIWYRNIVKRFNYLKSKNKSLQKYFK